VLRNKRRAGDFTIPKIDNFKQAFCGVAIKLHDAFPRPRVSQDVLGFVQRAKNVSMPLKATQLFHKKFLSPRELS